MLEWATVRRHVAEEITLLCKKHHHEATVGLLTADQVAQADRDPWNARHGVTTPYGLNFGGSAPPIMRIGSVEFRGSAGNQRLIPFAIDNVTPLMFGVEDRHLGLYAQVRGRDGRVQLKIWDNELQVATSAWDVEFVGQRLTIRAGRGDILVRARFVPPSTVHFERLQFRLNGVEVKVTGSTLAVGSQTLVMEDGIFEGLAGFTVGDCPDIPSAMYRFAKPA